MVFRGLGIKLTEDVVVAAAGVSRSGRLRGRPRGRPVPVGAERLEAKAAFE